MFVNINPGGMQWHPDLIGYNTMESYGSPSYYAQVMFGKYHGDQIPQTDETGTNPRFFYSVTRDSKNSEVYIKLVNAGSASQPVKIKLDGGTGVDRIANVVTLSAKTEAATNSINHPKNIIPVESRFERASDNFTYTVPPYSIQVLRVKTK
jgi:alpha-N-arabinofuranosidase